MVDTGGSSWHQSNRGVSVYITIYLALFVFVLVLSKFLHDRPRIGSLVPEAAMIILVGMAAGSVLHFVFVQGNDQDQAYANDGNAYDNSNNAAANGYEQVAESIFGFSPTVFFIILLPPIIFNSGYHLQRDLFFRYITPICLYACLGTAICTMVVAGMLYGLLSVFATEYFNPSFLELMAFGALISATDPVSTLAVFSAKKVDPQLFYLVFGESVINDAVGLVLFTALAHLIESHNQEGYVLNVTDEVFMFLFDFLVGFLGSLVLGTVFALLYGLLFKHIDMRSTKLLELCIYVTMVYSPFVVAEIFHLSGIVTVLMTGVAARRYAEPNLSRSTSDHADWIFRMLAHSTETIIFLELGLSVVELMGFGGHALNGKFLLISLAACLIGRAVNIFPITLLHNLAVSRSCCGRRDRGISKSAKKPLVKTMPTTTTTTTMDYYKSTDKDGTIRTEATTVPSSPSSTDSESSDDGNNLTMNDDSRIPWKTANMLWFSGLRGAVSYGLVKTFPQTGNEQCFVVTTMLIVLLTTFVFGGGTETALKTLHIDMNVDEEEYLKTVERKKLLGGGWLGNFEAYRVRAWALRDFEKIQKHEEQHPNVSGRGGGGGRRRRRRQGEESGVSSFDEEDGLYHEPVEFTEDDHLSVASKSSTTTRKKKSWKTKLYDFGQ